MLRISMVTVFTMASLVSGSALAQGQALPPVKVNLPPSPSFNVSNAPEKFPTGELSVYGVRKQKDKYMDKDVLVKAYLTEVYECPAELRKCNDALFEKKKAEKKKAMKKGGDALVAPINIERGGCRPCDQPHFFVADSPGTKRERALLVADYPVKDWDTGDPRPLVVKPGEVVTVTGTFSINSMTGFAASNGLLIHKRLVDSQGKVLAEGNAVLPPEAQTIQLEGQAPEVVGWAARNKGGGEQPKGDKSVPGGRKK